MKDYLKKLPEPVGKCKKCTINLYSIKDITGPVISPCGIEGCPYESKKSQEKIDYSKGQINVN